MSLLEWMTKWESLWLFTILFVETSVGIATLWILIKEYKYDENKDLEKKQRRTKTTKRVTSNPSGVTVTEESSEISEPVKEEGK